MNKERLSLLAFSLLYFFCAGCVQFPSQKGTRIGHAVPITLYTSDEKPHSAVQLSIQEGTKMGDPGLKHGFHAKTGWQDKFLATKAILVDKNCVVLDSSKYGDRRLKVSGTIQFRTPVDSNGARLISYTPRISSNSPVVFVTLKARAKDIVELNLVK